jgi:acyl carrier protein
MADPALIAQIKELIVKRLDLRSKTPDDIPEEGPLFGGSLGLDSLDALELAMALEEELGVMVPEGDAGRTALTSVRSIAELVTKARE